MDLKLQSSQEARAVLESISSALPCLSLLRDVCVIEGYVCRFTIGTLTLLQAANNRVFNGGDVDPDELDILEAFYLCCDEHIDDSVWIARDPDELSKAVKKFAKGLGRSGRKIAVNDYILWLNDTNEAMPQGDGSEGGSVPTDWWVDAVDVLASEYNWSEEYIIWQLPIIRSLRYQEALCARRSGERRAADISDETVKALELLEEKKESTDGKS